MKRRLIALLLCISLIGSMTVYATDDVTEPTEDLSLRTSPQTGVAISDNDTEPTVPTTVGDDALGVPESEPTSEPTVPATTVWDDAPGVPESELTSEPTVSTTVGDDAPGVPESESTSEPTVPETSAPVADPTEPSQVDVPAGPAVGDTIYIKSGSLTYKAAEETSAKREVVFNYKTKIVSIVTDELGNAAWYEFQPTGWLLLYKDYKFVKVENTTVTDPDASEPSEPSEPATKQEFDGKEFSTEIPVLVSTADVEEISKIEQAIPTLDDNCIRESFVYDISGQDQDNVEITVNGMIDIQKLNEYGRCYVDVYHLKGTGEIEVLRGQVNWNGDVTFETDSFSTFYFLVQYYTNNGTYKLSVASAASVSTILTECGVPSGFKISTVTSDPVKVKDENGNDIDWVKISGSANNTKVTLIEPFTGLRKLNVGTDKGTYVIDIAVPEVFYYLNSTDWCMDTTTSKFELGTENYGVRTTNTELIDVEDVTGGIVIYTRPGMVLQFTTGWRWGPDEDHLYVAHQDNGGWRWYSGNNQNYVIIDEDINAVKTFTIQFSQHDFSSSRLQHGTTATVHVIPEYKPTLLENVDGVELKTVPVTLFNYDGNAWKDYYTKCVGYNDQGLFEFKSASSGVPVTVETLTSSINYSGWTMGIFDGNLDENGLPVLTDGYPVDLFSDSVISHSLNGRIAKEAYSDVDFQFVYDSETGYYTYASQLNAAQFFENENIIKLYRENLSAADPGAAYQSNNAGFYPFIDVNKAFLNTAGSTGTGALSKTPEIPDPAKRDTYPSDDVVSDLDVWLDKLDDGYAQYSGYLAKDLVSTYDESGTGTVDMHFGLKVQTPFYLPKGKQINGQDVEFSFTGDDDLWVFIDGELVLDLGGGHGPMSGTINFTDGIVTAENRFGTTSYYQLKGENGSRTGETVTGDYSKDGYNWEADAMHTLSIFYLEKCSGHSNCYMRFNIPIIPEGAALVTKNVLNDEGQDSFAVDTDEEYTFIMYTAKDDDDTIDAANFEVLKDAPYTIFGGDGTILRTDATTGEFKLKAGQTAQLIGIDRFTEVYVVEQDPTGKYKYSKVEVDGIVTDYSVRDPYAKSNTKIIPNEGSISFTFTNYMEVSDLTISKELIDPYEVVTAVTEYKVDVQIAGTPYTGAALLNGVETSIENGKVSLKADDVLVIENIPTNVTYSVVETDPETAPGAPKIGTNTKSGYKYLDPTYKVDDAVAVPTAPSNTLDADTAVVITNELKQLFGNLKITKTGIDPLDHHEENGANKEEAQSTIYTVSGTSYSGETVNLEVVIVGNNSVTINHLPVGEYSVKEKTEWAWRYELDNEDNERTVEVEEDKTAQTTYNNKRTKVKWLSGDSYCENWWGSACGTVTKRN